MCDRLGIDVWEVVDAARDQAVRVHAVLSGPRPRRPLHSDRSVLPVVEGEAERLRAALHRARRPHQRRACRTHVVDKIADALNAPAEGAQRVDGARRRHRLQARHRRHARVAGARRHGRCCTRRARASATPIRYVPTLAATRVARRLRPGVRAARRRDARRGRLRGDPDRPQRVRLRRARGSARRSSSIRATRSSSAHPHVFKLGAPAPAHAPRRSRRAAPRPARPRSGARETHDATGSSGCRRSGSLTSTSAIPLLLVDLGRRSVRRPSAPVASSRSRRIRRACLDRHRRAQRSRAPAGAHRQPAPPRLPGRSGGEIIVVSDGSTDDTLDVLSQHRRRARRRRRPAGGKAAALNVGVAQGHRRHPRLRRRPSDVRARRAARAGGALRRSGRRRRDRRADSRLRDGGRRAGAAARPASATAGGPARRAAAGPTAVTESIAAAVHASTIGDGVGLYWRYEKQLRRLESTVGSTLGATGAIYALRRRCIARCPPTRSSTTC